MFLLMVISAVMPTLSSLEICTTTEKVIFQDVCCDQQYEANDELISISDVNSDCCDEISLSNIQTNSLFEKIQLTPLFRSIWFTIPTVTWILVESIEEIVIVEARGPPFAPVSLFMKNCSYII